MSAEPDVLSAFKSHTLSLVQNRLGVAGDGGLVFLVNKRDRRGGAGSHEYTIMVRGVELEEQTMQSLTAEMVQASANWPLKLKSCSVTENKLNLQLDRAFCFHKFISEVHELGCDYGRRTRNTHGGESGDTVEPSASAINSSRTDEMDCESVEKMDKSVTIVVAEALHEESVSLSLLRAVLLAEHVKLLLEADGRSCRLHLPSSSESLRSQLASLGFHFPANPEPCMDSLRPKLETFPCHEGVVRISVGEYMQREGLPRGKDGYSKNIDVIEVSVADDWRLRAVAELDAACAGLRTILHIVSAEREFRHQKLDLLWRNLGGPRDQRHLVFGLISGRTKSKEKMTVEEFVGGRRNENREASEHKFGPVRGSEWEVRVDQLTWAGVKFELLASNARGEIKLDFSDQSASSDRRAGAFVLYNHARLSALLSRYSSHVSEGRYPAHDVITSGCDVTTPAHDVTTSGRDVTTTALDVTDGLPLPGLDTVDFSLLREQEEWDLLLQFVMPYRGVVSACLEETDGVRARIHTHKVCQFLNQLSRLLSSYYNRCHVLEDSRPHLYPRMYARLYLLNAVKQVIHNGLSLLNIQPPSQM